MVAHPAEQSGGPEKRILYFLYGILFWIVVDFGTAGGFRLDYLRTYGLTLWLFYLGFPALMTVLIYKYEFNGRRLFLATLGEIFLVEVVFTRNPLVVNFPVCLLGIPLAVAVYSPLTFFPLWIVNGEIRRRWKIVLPLSLMTAAIMCLTTFGTGG